MLPGGEAPGLTVPALGPQKTIVKAKPARRPRKAYLPINELGKALAMDPAARIRLPAFSFPAGMKLGALTRALDPETGKVKVGLDENGKETDKFGSIYRNIWDKQDELFPTAAARNFIEGLVDAVPSHQLDPTTLAHWEQIVDAISSLRIPTRYSGFSVSGKVMQHPTKGENGFFSKQGGENHGAYDSDRVKYISAAITSAKAANQDLQSQFFASMRAAIEFTLNHFTAPITAANVKPFSTRATVASDDADLQSQLESRERIKDLYVRLGGSLRSLPAGATETPEQSWDRPWQLGLAKAAKARSFAQAPPSPKRQRRSATDPAAAATPAPVQPRAAPPTGAAPLSAPPIDVRVAQASAPLGLNAEVPHAAQPIAKTGSPRLSTLGASVPGATALADEISESLYDAIDFDTFLNMDPDEFDRLLNQDFDPVDVDTLLNMLLAGSDRLANDDPIHSDPATVRTADSIEPNRPGNPDPMTDAPQGGLSSDDSLIDDGFQPAGANPPAFHSYDEIVEMFGQDSGRFLYESQFPATGFGDPSAVGQDSDEGSVDAMSVEGADEVVEEVAVLAA